MRADGAGSAGAGRTAGVRDVTHTITNEVTSTATKVIEHLLEESEEPEVRVQEEGDVAVVYGGKSPIIPEGYRIGRQTGVGRAPGTPQTKLFEAEGD